MFNGVVESWQRAKCHSRHAPCRAITPSSYWFHQIEPQKFNSTRTTVRVSVFTNFAQFCRKFGYLQNFNNPKICMSDISKWRYFQMIVEIDLV